MQSFLHFKPFYIYNIILFILFCVLVSPSGNFQIIYVSLYCVFHLLLIYLGVYHFRKMIYLIFFLYGLMLDLLWFNEIGPHLLVFMISIIIINILLKYLSNFNSLKIYIFLLTFQILMILFEMFFSSIIINVKSDMTNFAYIFILSLTLSYPCFLFFSKIDKIK